MNDKQQEILDIAQEEAAEVIQEISKIRRFGIDENHRDGIPHRTKLEMEVADLLVMVDLMIETGIIDKRMVEAFKPRKVERLHLYSNIFKE